MTFSAQNISSFLPAQSGTLYYFNAMQTLQLDTTVSPQRTVDDLKNVVVRTFVTVIAVPSLAGFGVIYNTGVALFEAGRCLHARSTGDQEGIAEACFAKAADHAANGLTDLIVFVLSFSFNITIMLALVYAIAPQHTHQMFIRSRNDFMETVQTYLQSALNQEAPAALLQAVSEAETASSGDTDQSHESPIPINASPVRPFSSSEDLDSDTIQGE